MGAGRNGARRNGALRNGALRNRARRNRARRDAAFVACLAVVLGIGVLGVLLLNTSMQQQSDRLTAQRQRIAALATRTQQMRTAVDLAGDPALLAAKARALHLRPARTVRYVGVGRRVSGPRRAAGRARAG